MRAYRLPATLSAVLFDIDSTLYTNESYARAQVDTQIGRFAETRGMPVDDARKLVAEFRERRRAETGCAISLANALAGLGVSIAESVKWREELIEPGDWLAKDPLLADALDALNERGVALAAVTNNPLLVARKTLRAIGVEERFPVVVGLDTTGFSKPHERPFLAAAEALGVPPAECLSVGDRYDIDIALPLELGMGGVLVDGVADVYRLESILP